MFAMKKTVVKIIHVYQRILSPDRGIIRFFLPFKGACVMYPSCSEYMVVSVEKYGVTRGILRGILRIGRCNPYQKKLVDIP